MYPTLLQSRVTDFLANIGPTMAVLLFLGIVTVLGLYGYLFLKRQRLPQAIIHGYDPRIPHGETRTLDVVDGDCTWEESAEEEILITLDPNLKVPGADRPQFYVRLDTGKCYLPQFANEQDVNPGVIETDGRLLARKKKTISLAKLLVLNDDTGWKVLRYAPLAFVVVMVALAGIILVLLTGKAT